MFRRSLILGLALLAGCTSPTEPEAISVGDDFGNATDTLVAWGGQGHHMAVYTVTVPDSDRQDDSYPLHYDKG